MWNPRRVRVLAFALFECDVFVAVPAADAVHEVQGAQAYVEGYEWCSSGPTHLSSVPSTTSFTASLRAPSSWASHTLTFFRPSVPSPKRGSSPRRGTLSEAGLSFLAGWARVHLPSPDIFRNPVASSPAWLRLVVMPPS